MSAMVCIFHCRVDCNPMTDWYQQHYQCQQLGTSVCLPVHYEQLVLQPKVWLHKILDFLDVPWNESVLHHETLVNKDDGISLSKYVNDI